MKGFIEVTTDTYCTLLVNINKILCVGISNSNETYITYDTNDKGGKYMTFVKESYEEVKSRIRIAEAE